MLHNLVDQFTLMRMHSWSLKVQYQQEVLILRKKNHYLHKNIKRLYILSNQSFGLDSKFQFSGPAASVNWPLQVIIPQNISPLIRLLLENDFRHKLAVNSSQLIFSLTLVTL